MLIGVIILMSVQIVETVEVVMVVGAVVGAVVVVAVVIKLPRCLKQVLDELTSGFFAYFYVPTNYLFFQIQIFER
jgi:hypothetical protein